MKLSLKLMIQCGIVGLLPALVGVYVSQRQTSGTMQNFADFFQTSAGREGDKIDRLLYERYYDVQVFASAPVALDKSHWYKVDDANPLMHRMNEYVASYGIYALSMIVDLDGKVAAVSTRDGKGASIPSAQLAERNYRDAEWFKALAAERYSIDSVWAAKEHHGATGTYTDFVANSPEVRAVTGKSDGRAVTFSAPLKKDGKIVGYWTNWMTLEAVDGILADVAENAHVARPEIALVDHSGAVIASVNIKDGKLDGPGAKELLAGARSAQLAKNAEGTEMVVGTSPLDGAMTFPGLGWALILRAPSEVAAATALAESRRATVVQVGLLVLILAAAVLLGARTANPIARMAEAAERIASGDVEVEVAHESSDEVGQLARSFRGMVEYIRGVSSAAAAVSRGDFSNEIVPRSEKDELSASVARVTQEVKKLMSEAGNLAALATQGRVDGRLDANAYEGAYREVATGVNQMLDSLLAPIHEATEVLERMAARDLTATMVGDYHGDHSRLKDALNTAVGNVRSGLLQVARGAEQVKAASSQIASGSQTLASGASEQAAALTETRATLEGVASMTERNAANAEQATMLAASAHEASGHGAASMEELNQSVGRIRAAVMNTAEIIRDINQIAFQTNLLALNAAVEAARAGDAGRGFAVVADEVRNLAQQAKSAALKTEELLRGAIAQAEQGEAISKDVSGGLSSIVKAVEDVDSIIKQIAAASREQALGVHQVSEATVQMDQVTHNNAASSEELSSTAEELSAQALELASMVAHFRLEAERTAARPRNVPLPRAPSAVGGLTPQQLIPFDDQLSLRDF